ncbi:MAG: hypothetical protein EOP08_12170, partial [Proteobacteria bacterium]
MPVSNSSMRSIARCVLPVLVGPSTAWISPIGGTLTQPVALRWAVAGRTRATSRFHALIPRADSTKPRGVFMVALGHPMSARVVLVDGSALVYRAFYALPPHLKTKDGIHTNAVFGFATMFTKLFAGKRPTLGAVIFDPPGATVRDGLYAEYKAQRPPMPKELREQLPIIDDLVGAYNFPLLRVPGREADDVIATLAEAAVAAGHEVVIVSSDKDFAQLVRADGLCKMHDPIRDVMYDAELVRKKWGVPPERIVDLLALVGD